MNNTILFINKELLIARYLKFAIIILISKSPKSKKEIIIKVIIISNFIFNFFKSALLELGPHFLFLL
jgi:hypothetical protein